MVVGDGSRMTGGWLVMGWGGSSLDGSNASWKGELIGPAGSLIIMSHAWQLCSSVHHGVIRHHASIH